MAKYIPKTIKFISSFPRPVHRGSYEAGESGEMTAVPTFVLPGDHNPKPFETAKSWAMHGGNYYTAQKHKPKGFEPTILEEPNIAQDGYEIVQIEHRGNGGRAYKVITPQGFYVDLREGSAEDIMLNGTISQGEIEDPLIWVRNNNESQLIRVGSAMYPKYEEWTKERDAAGGAKPKKIKKSELVPFKIYKSKSGDQAVFIGFVNTFNFGYGKPDEHSAYRKAMLFYELRWNQKDGKLQSLQGLFGNDHNWKVTSSHSYLSCIGELESSFSSETVVTKVREAVIAKSIMDHQKHLAHHQKKYGNSYHYGYKKIQNLAQWMTARCYPGTVCMAQYPDDPIVPEALKPYLPAIEPKKVDPEKAFNHKKPLIGQIGE